MTLSTLLDSLHTNTKLTVYAAKRVDGFAGYTLLKPLFEGRARDCALSDMPIDHIFARSYNTIECYGYDRDNK